MECKVEFYEKSNGRIPVIEFIESLNAKQQEKIVRALEILEEFGSKLRYPEVDTIKGKKYQGLWELRIAFASDIFRIFYYFHNINTAILLHGIVKKQQKTATKELDIALNRMKAHKNEENK